MRESILVSILIITFVVLLFCIMSRQNKRNKIILDNFRSAVLGMTDDEIDYHIGLHRNKMESGPLNSMGLGGFFALMNEKSKRNKS